MMARPPWDTGHAGRNQAAPSTADSWFDPYVPHPARVYNAWLGGKDNYAADRDAAAKLLAAVPDAGIAARDNRAFLGRAVRFLAGEAGIRQFLDIGTGLPTHGNVHEIAHAADPAARVVYADNDPVVTTHANALLADAPTVAAVNADLRCPRDLLTSPAVRALIDFNKPVAVLLVAVLHFVDDSQDPWAIVECIKEHIAPGSYLVVSHVTDDELSYDARRCARQAYEGASAPGVARTLEGIARFFDGMVMVGPGLVNAAAWRSNGVMHMPRRALFYAGIGRQDWSASGVLL
jgi:S-adenosyl methyltransferase